VSLCVITAGLWSEAISSASFLLIQAPWLPSEQGSFYIVSLLCDATKKELYFSADRFRWVFMTKDNEVEFNKDFYLLYSTK
jgi:hypothetical protein